MDVYIKSTKKGIMDKQRIQWSRDPAVKRFVTLTPNTPTDTVSPASGFVRYYEIYQKKKRVGDIRIFGNREDIKKNVAQLLIVLGEKRGCGIGTRAVSLVLEQIKGAYKAVYCRVNRYNIASIRMLRRNGFVFRNLVGNEFILEHPFDTRR